MQHIVRALRHALAINLEDKLNVYPSQVEVAARAMGLTVNVVEVSTSEEMSEVSIPSEAHAQADFRLLNTNPHIQNVQTAEATLSATQDS